MTDQITWKSFESFSRLVIRPNPDHVGFQRILHQRRVRPRQPRPNRDAPGHPGHELHGAHGRVLERDGAELLHGGLAARHAEDPEVTGSAVGGVGPQVRLHPLRPRRRLHHQRVGAAAVELRLVLRRVEHLKGFHVERHLRRDAPLLLEDVPARRVVGIEGQLGQPDFWKRVNRNTACLDLNRES